MISDEEYKKLLKQFHKLSDRHVLVVETDMYSSDIQKVVKLFDKIRKAGNELVSLMRKNYDQLMRTKRYRKLLKLYGATIDKNKRKDLAEQLNEMQKQYNITWDYCRTSMIPIGKKYDICSVFAVTKAEDIWCGMEKCLYGNGNTIHFSKYGDLPCIRTKQINRGIPMSVKDNQLQFKLGKSIFGINVEDRFQDEEVNAILDYHKDSEIIDNKAIQTLIGEAYCYDDNVKFILERFKAIYERRNKSKGMEHTLSEGERNLSGQLCSVKWKINICTSQELYDIADEDIDRLIILADCFESSAYELVSRLNDNNHPQVVIAL